VPGVSVRRFLILALTSVGVLIASAILDMGSRASAAYLSTASRSVGAAGTGAGTGAGTATDETPGNPANYKRGDLPALANQPAGAGTTSSGTSGGPSGPNSPAAELPPKEPPPGNLVVYFREPAVRLELTKYIDSILDPPRQV
jgi:hypothetical protein